MFVLVFPFVWVISLFSAFAFFPILVGLVALLCWCGSVEDSGRVVTF